MAPTLDPYYANIVNISFLSFYVMPFLCFPQEFATGGKHLPAYFSNLPKDPKHRCYEIGKFISISFVGYITIALLNIQSQWITMAMTISCGLHIMLIASYMTIYKGKDKWKSPANVLWGLNLFSITTVFFVNLLATTELNTTRNAWTAAYFSEPKYISNLELLNIILSIFFGMYVLLAYVSPKMFFSIYWCSNKQGDGDDGDIEMTTSPQVADAEAIADIPKPSSSSTTSTSVKETFMGFELIDNMHDIEDFLVKFGANNLAGVIFANFVKVDRASSIFDNNAFSLPMFTYFCLIFVSILTLVQMCYVGFGHPYINDKNLKMGHIPSLFQNIVILVVLMLAVIKK